MICEIMEYTSDILKGDIIKGDIQDVDMSEGILDVTRLNLRGGRIRRTKRMRLVDNFQNTIRSTISKRANEAISGLTNAGLDYITNRLQNVLTKPNARETECPPMFQTVAPQKDGRKYRNVMRIVRSLNLHKVYQLFQYYHCSAFPRTATLTFGATETTYVATTTTYYYSYNGIKGFSQGLYCEHSKQDRMTQGYNYGDVTNCIDYPTQVNTTTPPGRIWNPAGFIVNHSSLMFMASYPFETMLPYPNTQNTAVGENFRMWQTTAAKATTDPSYPIRFEDIFSNQDWNRLVILGVKYTMEFVNYNPMDMVVEVLFFKFIVDIDQFERVGQAEQAIWNQFTDYNTYCKGGFKLGNNQIQIVQRDRFVIKAPEKMLHVYNSGAYAGANHKANVVRKTYYCKKKWSYVRATQVKEEATTLTENSFANTGIDREEQVWCRIAAWQKDGLVTMQAPINNSDDANTGNTLGPYREQQIINQANCNLQTDYTGQVITPTGQLTTNEVGRPMVDVQIWKRPYVQIDSDIFKSYAPAT